MSIILLRSVMFESLADEDFSEASDAKALTNASSNLSPSSTDVGSSSTAVATGSDGGSLVPRGRNPCNNQRALGT